MARAAAAVILGLLVVAVVDADLYMHFPRGSNNRLNEQSANRDNDNRLFDSQDNGRGGYNVGDKTSSAFDEANPTGVLATAANGFSNDNYAAAHDPTNLGIPMQYQEVYFEGSVLTVEWTNQHACGGNDVDDPQILNCNMLLQYTCDTVSTGANTYTDAAQTVRLWDGGNTNTPTAPSSFADTLPGALPQNLLRGHHESEAWYWECSNRFRNWWLFHADQGMGGDDATHTRQNNNGNQHGLECPEERDYWPYWTPTPWKDVAYLSSFPSMCKKLTDESFNVKAKWKCVGGTVAAIQQIDKQNCQKNGGTWTQFQPFGLPAPDCGQVGWSRVNHLGNGRDGQALTYNWTLPTIATLQATGVKMYGSLGAYAAKCVARLRYNLSTDDYDPWNIDNSMDDNQYHGVVSPVQQNPTIDVGADLNGLRLAINTAQFGRTFQDRSHVFYIIQRPTFTGAPSQTSKIYNLGVRGKRCNIVQCYPAVEYDFIPNFFTISTSDMLHIQWTGSNTHNNGNNGGDGQTGDAGQGTEGTDRHNFVQMLDPASNYPIPLDKFTTNIFSSSQCWHPDGSAIAWLDCAVILASSGYYRSAAQVNTLGASATTYMDPLLNNAPASLIGGVVMQINTPGTYYYACTRNNAFSNRSQKGVLIVQ